MSDPILSRGIVCSGGTPPCSPLAIRAWPGSTWDRWRVSGALGRERVHFEAPPADRLESETVPIEILLERLEISRATFKRDLDYLRDRLHAPFVWDRGMGGYRFDGSSGKGTRAGPRHELPGLCFNSSEAYALLAM